MVQSGVASGTFETCADDLCRSGPRPESRSRTPQRSAPSVVVPPRPLSATAIVGNTWFAPRARRAARLRDRPPVVLTDIGPAATLRRPSAALNSRLRGSARLPSPVAFAPHRETLLRASRRRCGVHQACEAHRAPRVRPSPRADALGVDRLDIQQIT